MKEDLLQQTRSELDALKKKQKESVNKIVTRDEVLQKLNSELGKLRSLKQEKQLEVRRKHSRGSENSFSQVQIAVTNGTHLCGSSRRSSLACVGRSSVRRTPLRSCSTRSTAAPENWRTRADKRTRT